MRNRSLARRGASFVVLVVAVLAGVLSPVRADAAYYAGTTGRIGNVSLNGPRLIASDLQRPSYVSKHFTAGGLTVSASPASSGWQRVSVRTMVQRYDLSSWTTIQSRDFSGWAGGSQGVSIPSWTYSPAASPWRLESYRVTHLVMWEDYNTGRVLGYTTIRPNVQADNACRTYWSRCTAYPDSVRF